MEGKDGQALEAGESERGPVWGSCCPLINFPWGDLQSKVMKFILVTPGCSGEFRKGPSGAVP